MPDAETVVGICGMKIAEHLLQLHPPAGCQRATVLHHGDHHVVGRRGHIQGLAGVAEVLDALHGCGFEDIAIDECRVVLAEEGMAEGPLKRVQGGQQCAVARFGAVADILLIVGRCHGHIVGCQQALVAGRALRVDTLGQGVGALVGALVHQAVEAVPVSLPLSKKCCRQHSQQHYGFSIHKKEMTAIYSKKRRSCAGG